MLKISASCQQEKIFCAIEVQKLQCKNIPTTSPNNSHPDAPSCFNMQFPLYPHPELFRHADFAGRNPAEIP
jgi:hypothetical protein